MSRYAIIGIVEPGRINVKLDGRFQDIKLHEASDEVLKKLYLAGCNYIQQSPGEFLKKNKNLSDIKIEKINLTGKRKNKTTSAA